MRSTDLVLLAGAAGRRPQLRQMSRPLPPAIESLSRCWSWPRVRTSISHAGFALSSGSRVRETTDAERGIERMPDAARSSIITAEMETPRARIVVGYNGSDMARAVVAHAARRARGHGKLVVVHACHEVVPSGAPVPRG
jgi:hypothetical protein